MVEAHDYRDKTIIMSEANPLTPDDAEDNAGTKENFIGRVIGSNIDGHVQQYLDDGYNPSGQEFESDVPTFDHFAYIEPLTEYEKHQNIFRLAVRSGRNTKWMVMMAYFYNVHGEEWEEEVETYQDIPEFITGRIYEWRDIGWTEDEEIPQLGVTIQEVGRNFEQISPMLIPVREVTDEDELADLGVEGDVAVDTEVEL